MNTHRHWICLIAVIGLLWSSAASAHPPAAGAPPARRQPAPQAQPAQPMTPPAMQQRGPRSQPPRRRSGARIPQRWGGSFSMALAHYTAFGDRSFGLNAQLANELEFEDSTGLDFFLGGHTPGGMFDIGLRLSFGFGPLNTRAWENELGQGLDVSTLLTIGPSLLWHPRPGARFDPYVGIDWLLVSMGTSESESQDVCDEFGDCFEETVDLPHVNYGGWAFGYVAGVRLFPSRVGRAWWLHVEVKYLQTTWNSLTTSDGFTETERPENVSNMALDQFNINFGIGVAL